MREEKERKRGEGKRKGDEEADEGRKEDGIENGMVGRGTKERKRGEGKKKGDEGTSEGGEEEADKAREKKKRIIIR